MQTMTVNTFKFEELNDSAKENARSWWRDLENSDFDTDNVIEDAERVGAILGITFNTRPVKLVNGNTRRDPCIYWSGFSSQGDGACFEGSYSYAKGAVAAMKAYAPQDTVLLDLAGRLTNLQRPYFYRLEATTAHRGHYNHSGCMTVDVSSPSEHVGADAEEHLTQCLRDFADWIYRQLEAEYTWRMADEQVDDSITCNEYNFLTDGSRA